MSVHLVRTVTAGRQRCVALVTESNPSGGERIGLAREKAAAELRKTPEFDRVVKLAGELKRADERRAKVDAEIQKLMDDRRALVATADAGFIEQCEAIDAKIAGLQVEPADKTLGPLCVAATNALKEKSKEIGRAVADEVKREVTYGIFLRQTSIANLIESSPRVCQYLSELLGLIELEEIIEAGPYPSTVGDGCANHAWLQAQGAIDGDIWCCGQPQTAAPAQRERDKSGDGYMWDRSQVLVK